MNPASGATDLRMKYGYIPCDLFNEAVAYDMEYALADWAVAQVAKELGKAADCEPFPRNAAKSYRHFFDPQTRFMRGRDSKGRLAHAFQSVPPRRTAPTTTARATHGSTRGSCRTTSRG